MSNQLFRYTFLFCSIFLNSQLYGCVCIWPSPDIDSLEQLKEYEFIARVKILDANTPFLRIKVLDLFKGEEEQKILNMTQFSSCAYGIKSQEEWILFARRSKENLLITACDRNVRYKHADGERDWKFENGIAQLRSLKSLYGQLPETKYEGARKEYYSNGQLEIKEYYEDGKLSGERKIWYSDGALYGEEKYVDGKIHGNANWYFPSGQIHHESLYDMGKAINVSRIYYDSAINPMWKPLLIEEFYKTEDSLNFVFRRVQPQYESIHDAEGHPIISREYSRLGKIKSETTFDPARNASVSIGYHENGKVASIRYRLDGKNYGRYQSFNEDGILKESWEYNEEGKKIIKD